MILAVGIDIVEVSRIKKALDRFGNKFVERLFNPTEISYCCGKILAAECLAGTFAAKEAFLKALGTGIRDGINWLDMEVVRQKGYPPNMKVSGRAREAMEKKGGSTVLLSISHDGGLAIATVLIQ